MIKNDLFFDKNFDNNDLTQLHNKIKLEIESNDIGYYHLPENSNNIIDQAKNFIKDKSFKNFVLIGIGGSNLGIKAVLNLLQTRNFDKNFYFLDNVDNYSFLNIMQKIKFDDTLFIVSSKSGTTIETITLFKCIINHFKVDDFSKNFVVITDSGSSLQKFAQEKHIEIFEIFPNVGGRFSILSAIGIVPFVFMGIDVGEILSGAKSIKEEFIKNSKNEILQKALHYTKSNHIKINVLFSYADRFKEFNAWYVQLWAESLGKISNGIKSGLTPAALIGSIDQHSYLQLIIQGENNKSVTFIRLNDCDLNDKIPNITLHNLESCDFVNGIKMQDLLNSQCDATSKALIDEGISVDVIKVDHINEFNIGWLIMYFEILTSCVGSLLKINTYDQPGVEIGKKILKDMLTKK